MPTVSHLNSKVDVNWDTSVYRSHNKDIPENAPTPLGNSVTLLHYFDANLMHNTLSGKSITGCIHIVNKTPIIW